MKRNRTKWILIVAAFVSPAALFWACSSGSSPTEPAAPAPSTGGSPTRTAEQVQGPGIDIEKATNGVDADSAPGPSIPVGDPVEWSYLVTNIGDVGLTNVVVADSPPVTISCPATTLQAGASMTCTAPGTAVAGQYENTATVTADDPDTQQVSDSDMSHYFGGGSAFAAIDLEKSTNGVDADFPRGPFLKPGDTVDWTYTVTNIGDVDLTNVTVADSPPVTISCPETTLLAGASMMCTATDTAVANQYENTATVTADDPENQQVSDSDTSHYFGVNPAVVIEKATDGKDADVAPGPTLFEGCPVGWSYEVTNTGNIELDVTVTDNQGAVVTCPATSVAPGDSITCTAPGTVVLGPYENQGEVTGTDPLGTLVSDVDLSHYFGENVCSGAVPSTEILWPPNHKFVSIDIGHPCGLPLAVTITSIMQDEPTNGLGDGDTSPDGQGVGTNTAEVRAERSGTGNGRVYHIEFTGDDGQNGTCTGEVIVGVPHDKKDEPVDDGPTYDSTIP